MHYLPRLNYISVIITNFIVCNINLDPGQTTDNMITCFIIIQPISKRHSRPNGNVAIYP